MRTGLASRPWLIVPIVIALHVTFGIGVVRDPSVAKITAINLIDSICGPWTPGVFFTVAVIAALPILIPRMRADCVHLCLWPQQTVLFLMTASVFMAAAAGSYPDGTQRPFDFIFTDQCLAVYVTVGHLAATLRNAIYGRHWQANGHFR